MRKVVLPVALAVACLGVVACGSTSQGSSAGGGGEFHLGAMADLTGPSAQTGRSLMNGIKASVEGINARGGVDGRKIALTTRDDGNAQATGVSGIRALIGQKDVLGVLGVNSSFVASTVAPLLQKTKTPMASVAFPPELVSPPRDGIYMTIAKQDAQGAAQIDFVKQLSQSGRLPKGPRVGWVTTSGGTVDLLYDYLDEIGGTTAPVSGSGSCPAWMARVSKPSARRASPFCCATPSSDAKHRSHHRRWNFRSLGSRSAGE